MLVRIAEILGLRIVCLDLFGRQLEHLLNCLYIIGISNELAHKQFGTHRIGMNIGKTLKDFSFCFDALCPS